MAEVREFLGIKPNVLRQLESPENAWICREKKKVKHKAKCIISPLNMTHLFSVHTFTLNTFNPGDAL